MPRHGSPSLISCRSSGQLLRVGSGKLGTGKLGRGNTLILYAKPARGPKQVGEPKQCCPWWSTRTQRGRGKVRFVPRRLERGVRVEHIRTTTPR